MNRRLLLRRLYPLGFLNTMDSSFLTVHKSLAGFALQRTPAYRSCSLLPLGGMNITGTNQMRTGYLCIQFLKYHLDIIDRLDIMLKQINLINRTLCGI